MWKLFLYINSIRCMPRNSCVFCPLSKTKSAGVAKKKSREVTGLHPDYVAPRSELCVQLLKVALKKSFQLFILCTEISRYFITSLQKAYAL